MDVDLPYRFFGLTEALSWLAQFSGQGFEDVSALTNLILLQEAMLLEEHSILQASHTNLAAPGTPTVTARAAATGETAISGADTSVWIKVTALNYYGETVASSAGSTLFSTGVADVAIDPTPGAAQYNIYVATGSTAGTYYLAAANVGGHRYTLQGALPTGGTEPPSADTGTGSANDYDGLFDILDGFTTAGTYPASGYQGGYVNQSVGSMLTNEVLFDLFAGLWDDSAAHNSSDSGGFRADPAELIGEGLDLSNFSKSILTQGAGGQQAYSLFITQDEVANIRAGAAISQIQNPITRSLVKILTHPYLQQGNLLALSYQLPMSFSNVSNAWEITNVQDYLTISWPVIDVTFRHSLFLYGVLCGTAPQFSGRLGGIQRSGAATNGNWS